MSENKFSAMSMVIGIGVAVVATLGVLQVVGLADLSGRAAGWEEGAAGGCAADAELDADNDGTNEVNSEELAASNTYTGILNIYGKDRGSADSWARVDIKADGEMAYDGTFVYQGDEYEVEFAIEEGVVNYSLSLDSGEAVHTTLRKKDDWTVEVVFDGQTHTLNHTDDYMGQLETWKSYEVGRLFQLSGGLPMGAYAELRRTMGMEPYSTDAWGWVLVGGVWVFTTCSATEQVCDVLFDDCDINLCNRCWPSTCQPATCSHDCDCAENDEEIEEFSEDDIDCNNVGMRGTGEIPQYGSDDESASGGGKSSEKGNILTKER